MLVSGRHSLYLDGVWGVFWWIYGCFQGNIWNILVASPSLGGACGQWTSSLVSTFFSFFSPLFLSPSWFPCLSLQLFKVTIPFVFPSTLIHVFFITIFYIKGLIKLGLYCFNSLQLFYLTYLIFIVLIAIFYFIFFIFLIYFVLLILNDWEFCFMIFFICRLWSNLVLWPESRVSDISMIWLQSFSFSLRFFVYFYFYNFIIWHLVIEHYMRLFWSHIQGYELV